MKVTPHKKKFGRYALGQVFELPDRAAKLLIKVGKLEAAPAESAPLVVAEPVPEPVVLAPEVSVAEAEAAEPKTEAPQAEETQAERPESETAVEAKVMIPADVPEARTKRQYHRRDMTAEGGKSAPAKKAPAKKRATKKA